VDKAYSMHPPNNIFGFESYIKAVKKELGLGKRVSCSSGWLIRLWFGDVSRRRYTRAGEWSSVLYELSHEYTYYAKAGGFILGCLIASLVGGAMLVVRFFYPY